MDKKQLRGSGILLLAALIWGGGFVAQSSGMEYIQPFTFITVRCLLAGLSLLPVCFLLDRAAGRRPSLWGTRDPAQRRLLLRGGVACGCVMMVSSNLQQHGLLYTSVGKAGFITVLYIVLVPILGIFCGRKARANVWFSVAIALAGMYFLCVNGRLALGPGDILMLLGALACAVHILVVDRFSPRVDDVRLSCIQFFVASALSAVPMFLFETPDLSAILAAAGPLLYSGVASGGIGYTLQIIGQRDVPPAVASLLLSMESVFSLLAGWLILGQTLSPREILGCAFVFAAILLAQSPAFLRRKE